MGAENDDFLEMFKGVKVRFGLVAQGHIPTIENMLDEHKSWEDIAEAIGWTPRAACEAYVQYLRRQRTTVDVEQIPSLDS